jgi:hypothetical protein
MKNSLYARVFDAVRLIVVVIILLLLAWHIVTNATIQWNFLSMSLLLVVLAAVNLATCYVLKEKSWMHYAIFLFVAMLFGSLGDFLMAGILYITPNTLINGILGFGIGHVFYLFALRNVSPLLLRASGSTQDSRGSRRLLIGNLAIWLGVVAAGVMLFFATVFNPLDLVLSIGALAYGVLLLTVLAFAVTKWFEGYPVSFRLSLLLGFLLFFLSDWTIAVRALYNPFFLSDLFIGVTYILAQLLIQVTPILIGRTRT